MSDEFALVYMRHENARPLILLQIRDKKITAAMLDYALNVVAEKSPPKLAKYLLAPTRGTTLLHEMMRHCDTPTTQWLFDRLFAAYPAALAAKEPDTGTNVIQSFTQRAPAAVDDANYWKFYESVIYSVDPRLLCEHDKKGVNALQFIAAFCNEHTQRIIFTLLDKLSPCSPETICMRQMQRDLTSRLEELESLRKEVARLQFNLDAADHTCQLREEEMRIMQKCISTEHVKIAGLSRQLGQEPPKTVELTRKDIAFAGLTEENSLLLEEANNRAKAAEEQADSAVALLEKTKEHKRAAKQVARLEKELAESVQRVAELEALARAHESELEIARRELAAAFASHEKEIDSLQKLHAAALAAEKTYQLIDAQRLFDEQMQLRVRQIDAAHIRDIESLQTRHGTDLERLRQECDAAVAAVEADLQQLAQAHRAELLSIAADAEKTAAQHVLALEAEQKRHMQEIDKLRADKVLEQTALRHQCSVDIGTVENRLRQMHAAELEQRQAANRLHIEQLVNEHQAQLAERVALTEQRLHKDLASSQLLAHQALEAARANNEEFVHRSELTKARDELEEARRMHGDALRELAASHRADTEKMNKIVDQARRERADMAANLELALQKNEELLAVQQPAKPVASVPELQMSPRRQTLKRRQTQSSHLIATVSAVSDASEINGKFFARLVNSCKGGEKDYVRRMLEEEGISANTCDAKTSQCLLEITFMAANETFGYLRKNAKKLTGDASDVMLRGKALVDTMRVIIENGGEWDGIDEHVERLQRAGECYLQENALNMIRNRDDMSPFVRAVLSNNTDTVGELLEKQQNLDRIPTLRNHAYEKNGYSFMHLAVLCANKQKKKGILSSMASSTSSSAPAASATMVFLLVQAGATCERTDANDCSALHLALLESKRMDRSVFLGVVELLLAGGADPDEECPFPKFIKKASQGAKQQRNSSLTEREKKQSESEFAARYNTPVKWARQLGDTELLERLTSRRYRRLTSAKLLSDIEESVKMACRVREMQAAGELVEGDELHRIIRVYDGVFNTFNPSFIERNGAEYTFERLCDAAGVSRDTTDMEKAIDQVIDAHELFVNLVKMGGANIPPGTPDAQKAYLQKVATTTVTRAADANVSARWKVTETLMKCMDACRKRIFSVSPIIRTNAVEIFADSVLAALASFVRQDMCSEMASMIGRADRLYGDVQIDTVVQPIQKYQCIDIAVQSGSLRCLEWLMERQKGRMANPAATADVPCGESLITLAIRSSRAISLVAIDHYRWNNRMSAERCPNAMNYAMTIADSHTTVLHACALLGRYDLLAFCIEYAQMHIQSKTTNGAGFTPLQLAKNRLVNLPPTDLLAFEETTRCIQLLEERSAAEQPDSMSLPPPPLLLPPPLRT